MPVYLLGILAGVLHLVGYIVYISFSLTKGKGSSLITPNPTTWGMFAYGTFLLTILEWDRNASLPLLILPIICSTLSIYVAVLCFKHGTLQWPKDHSDQTAFLIDLALTAAYVVAWILQKIGAISNSDREILVILFLILSNADTLASFWPIFHGTLKEPRNEHPLPWFIWSSAYLVLGITTMVQEYGIPTTDMTDGTRIIIKMMNHKELLVYPFLNMALHFLIGALALRRYGHSSIHV